MPRKKYNCTAEQFVEVWQTSTNARQAAETLGMPLGILYARAAGYRSQGINLKKMPRKSRRLDVQALNRLVERLTPQTERIEDGGSFAF